MQPQQYSLRQVEVIPLDCTALLGSLGLGIHARTSTHNTYAHYLFHLSPVVLMMWLDEVRAACQVYFSLCIVPNAIIINVLTLRGAVQVFTSIDAYFNKVH